MLAAGKFQHILEFEKVYPGVILPPSAQFERL